MRRFLRKSAIQREPLAVTMTGIRRGERVLQIGVGDVRLAAMLAAVPGISGQSAIVVSDDPAHARARAAAADSGSAVDVHVSAVHQLPFEDAAFDLVVVHDAAHLLAAVDSGARVVALTECRRVLRSGGRLVAVEAGTPTGLKAFMTRPPAVDPAYEGAGGTPAALEAAGFRPVRLLADREGYRFVEGLTR